MPRECIAGNLREGKGLCTAVDEAVGFPVKFSLFQCSWGDSRRSNGLVNRPVGMSVELCNDFSLEPQAGGDRLGEASITTIVQAGRLRPMRTPPRAVSQVGAGARGSAPRPVSQPPPKDAHQECPGLFLSTCGSAEPIIPSQNQARFRPWDPVLQNSGEGQG